MNSDHSNKQPQPEACEPEPEPKPGADFTPAEKTLAHILTCRMTDWVGAALLKMNLPVPVAEHANAGATIGDGIRDVVLGFVTDLRGFKTGVPWATVDELIERNALLLVKHVHGLPGGTVIPFPRDGALN